MATTGAGAIGVVLTADTASFESSMDRAAASTERSMQRTVRAQQSAQRQGEALVGSIQRQIDTFGMSSTQLLAYEARLKGVGDQAQPLIDRLERMKAAQAGFAAGAAGAGAVGAAGITQLADASKRGAQQVQQLGYQVNDFFVQVTSGQSVMTAAIQQGAQLQGVFRNLGEATAALGRIFSPVVLGIGAIAAVAGSIALAFSRGAAEDKAFGESLRLTGNFAGQTRDGMEALSLSIAALPRNSIGPTREALQLLVSTGRFTSESLGSVGRAVVAMAAVSGRSAEEIVKDFSTMSAGVAKWAAEANKSYHYITAAQYEYIKALEAQGKQQEAVAINSQLLAAALEKAKGQLGFLEKSWDAVKKAAGGAWDAMKGIGKADTVGQELVAAQNALAEMMRKRALIPADGGIMSGGSSLAEKMDATIAEQRAFVENLKARQDLATVAAAASSRIAEAEQKKIEESSSQHQQALGAIALAGFRDRAAKAELARQEMAIGIQRSYEEGNVTLAGYLEWQYKLRRAALTDEMALIGQEAAAAAKVKPGTPTEAIERESRITEIQTRRVGVLQKIAELEEKRRRGDLLPDKLVTASVATPQQQFNAFEHGAAAETAATIARMVEDRAKFIESLRQQNLAVDAEIEKLDAERMALGGSTIEREKAVAVAKLQAQADKNIAANGSDRERILAELAQRTDRLTTAMQANYDASRSFDVGVQTAFTRYRDEAANSAKFGEGVVGGSLDRITDSLTELATTGRTSFSGLFKFMADEFIKNWIRMQVAQQTQSGSSFMSIFKAFAGFFGAGNTTADGAGGMSNQEGAYPTSITGTKAGGGDVLSGKNYLVGERGPEVLRMGKAGGTVIPNEVSGSARSGLKVVVNAPPGTQVDRQQERQGDDGQELELWLSAAERHIAGRIGANRGPVPAALRGRGVSTSGNLPKRG